MPALDMRRETIEARSDLAYAMFQQNFPITAIQQELNFKWVRSAHQAIERGRQRSRLNENRISVRMFGVEMEFNRTNRRRAKRYINQIDPNVAVEIEGYNHYVREHWKMVTDASVSATGTGGTRAMNNTCTDCRPAEGMEHNRYCDCDCHNTDDRGNGLEMVSPILRGADGFKQLATVVKGIREAGGGVDRSCGLHIHHDARDMSPKALARLLSLYTENQTNIDELLPASRRSSNSNQWCRPWHDDEKEGLMRGCGDGFRRGYFDRYKTINVTSYPKYGSIEFRQHQGTLNVNKIMGWVKFGQALMEASIKTEDVTEATKFESIEAMLEWLVANGGLPKTTAEYLKGRAESYRNR